MRPLKYDSYTTLFFIIIFGPFSSPYYLVYPESVHVLKWQKFIGIVEAARLIINYTWLSTGETGTIIANISMHKRSLFRKGMNGC